MGILEKISKTIGLDEKKEDKASLDEYMKEIEMENADALNPAADFYVKPIKLRNDEHADLVISELKTRNIVMIDISDIAKQEKRVKRLIGKIKDYVVKNNGDIAMISPQKILATPSRVKIIKTRKS